jgi:hypothetical protein
MQCGWYKEVRVKDLGSHAIKAVLISRALLVKIKRDIENQIRGLLKNLGAYALKAWGVRLQSEAGSARQRSPSLESLPSFCTESGSKAPDLNATHDHEEKLRTESMAIIHGDPELSKRLAVIEKAMALIFAHTVDHTSSRSDDEAAMQMLGIRLFNAAASSVKLALSGYYQTAFQQARDIMETGFLLDYFRTSPEKIAVWKAADRATRRKLFDPVQIRKALDEHDGDTEMRRAAEYSKLSELASHAT